MCFSSFYSPEDTDITVFSLSFFFFPTAKQEIELPLEKLAHFELKTKTKTKKLPPRNQHLKELLCQTPHDTVSAAGWVPGRLERCWGLYLVKLLLTTRKVEPQAPQQV